MLSKGLDRTIKDKPLGERRRAVLRQELMVFLGNTGVMGAGMAVALPSVTVDQLTDTTEAFHISKEEASWFCMLVFVQFLLKTCCIYVIYCGFFFVCSLDKYHGLSSRWFIGGLSDGSNWPKKYNYLNRCLWYSWLGIISDRSIT